MQPDSNILQIDNLSKYFGGLAAVANCSLKIKRGSITGIIGPNGSGKTTLFNLIAGNLKCSEGKVLFNNEKLSKNFWSTSGMMAPFYELLSTMSNWLVKRGVKRDKAQKYITSLFVALSEDAVVNSKKDLKFLVKESQTPRGLNEQGVKELRKAGFFRSTEKTLNSILKRLNKV